jgi:lon-related putative ATP-dependent protease
MLNELALEQLRRVHDPRSLDCDSSADVEPLHTIIGQERAVNALQFGLGIKGVGFNIYVAGPPGTGKSTAVTHFLQEVARDKPTPDDWCYVNNFQDTYQPNALRFPPGQAREFQADMRELVRVGVQAIRSAFESEEYANRREETVKAIQQNKEQLFNELNQQAHQEGLFVQITPMGFLTIPIRDGKPIGEEEFMGLDPKTREQLTRKQTEFQSNIKTFMRQMKNLDKQTSQRLQELDREVASFAINHLIEDVQEKYEELSEVVAYLEAVHEDLLDNLPQLRGEGQSQPSGPLPLDEAERERALLRKYEVNILVDNAKLSGSPVITELNPTYTNLFGRIEKEAYFGTMISDFTLIRAGALHRANGGYLALPVEELLRAPLSWEGLKRALRNQVITIEEPNEQLGFFSVKGAKPEPIPLDLKVILVGRSDLYHLLHTYDEDFSQLFKVKADFDNQMERTESAVHDYTAFVCGLCNSEGLNHLDRTALAKIVEYGSRLAEDQEKLSTKFGNLADIIREANYYAMQAGVTTIEGSHIRQAIEARFYRSALLHERIQEMIARGTLLIDVTDQVAGQVNGLSVLSMGDISFGQPSRITVTIGLGQEGLVDIEREAEMSGPIHTKGVLILAGYLSEQFAQDKPLSLSARLVFEQNYAGVEGDSASSTELYALLSALANLPIKQGLAVTGSVNQKGEIQAIGGVNEKIEGFFEVCRAKGLTGQQGVLIPASNVKNLMLKEDIVEAVQAGQFHIWPVSHIGEGIELLTGVKAGRRLEDGRFEEDSVNDRVDKRLRDLAEMSKAFGKEKEEG